MTLTETSRKGRHLLIVDDDVRNVFALTSVLEARGVRVLFAENGREGLELLDANPDVDLVLMDVMMPEMDGYEAMRAIRARERPRSRRHRRARPRARSTAMGLRAPSRRPARRGGGHRGRGGQAPRGY